MRGPSSQNSAYWRSIVLLGIALLVLATIGLVAYRAINGFAESKRSETHTQVVIRELEGLLSVVRDAETSQRGFIITGIRDYLEPYESARAEVSRRLSRLRTLTDDDPRQQDRLARLAPAIQERMAALETGIGLRRSQGFAAAAEFAADGSGKQLMDQIRQLVVDGQEAENKLLRSQSLAVARAAQVTTRSLWAGGVGASVLILVAFFLLLRETSARGRAENALRASETHYRRLFEAARDGVLLIDAQTHRITDANPFVSELLGQTREELIGKELWEIGIAKDAAASREAFRQLTQTGYARYEDLPLQIKTGEIREVEFISNLYEEGPQSVVQCNIRDMTGRKRAQAVQQHFRALFESVPGSFLVLKPDDYEIVAVSEAYLRATMTERSKIEGKRLFEVFPDDPSDVSADGTQNLRLSLERVKASRSADAMAVQRYPIRRPESEGGGFEERWWSPVNSPVLGADGQITAIIHRVEDVTPFVHQLHAPEKQSGDRGRPNPRMERLQVEIMLRGRELARANERLQRSEEKLQVANRDLTDFATIVSHDLKAPLRGVASLAKWVQSDYAEKLDEPGREKLAEMGRRVGRMDRMIDDILTYSRLGRVEEKPEPVPLASLLPLIVQDLSPPPSVTIHIAPELPTVMGEPVRLRQVFQNLISNAIVHAGKPDVAVHVDWSDAGRHWEFHVSDNGPGIEARHFERIFRIFQTLKPKDKSDSTGVGLALVKRIVELAGGKVWLDSGIGVGSTFHFTWPKAAPQEAFGAGPAAIAGSAEPARTNSP